jgi:hypothetical protein
MKYYIDRCTRDEVAGWAFGDTRSARIDTFIDDRKVDLRTTRVVRHDVGDAYPQIPHSTTSGFRIHLPDTPLSKTKRMSSLRLVISADGHDDSVEFQLPSAATVEASRLIFWQTNRSPFSRSDGGDRGHFGHKVARTKGMDCGRHRQRN